MAPPWPNHNGCQWLPKFRFPLAKVCHNLGMDGSGNRINGSRNRGGQDRGPGREPIGGGQVGALCWVILAVAGHVHGKADNVSRLPVLIYFEASLGFASQRFMLAY